MTLEQQLATVKMLKNTILQQQIALTSLKELLQQEERTLEILCQENGGHDYERESDGDYHRSGWYYYCKRCNHFKR